MIRIDIPATSANLGSGFDSLGIALTMHNRVWMEEADTLEISTTDDVQVPTDESNLIYWAAKHLYEICGKQLPGLRIIQENNIPMARGLGSSFGLHRGGHPRREPHARVAALAGRPHQPRGADRRAPRQHEPRDLGRPRRLRDGGAARLQRERASFRKRSALRS